MTEKKKTMILFQLKHEHFKINCQATLCSIIPWAFWTFQSPLAMGADAMDTGHKTEAGFVEYSGFFVCQLRLMLPLEDMKNAHLCCLEKL